jgi:bifunctional UDP-N-acetylglucosamine pyrophosphorylase/glucosamine-1-phosphate N-acetyltransferase
MAAGLGTRMKSNRAKVLHELGGATLIAHVVRAAHALEPRSIIVIVGHQAEEVERATLAEVGELASFVVQEKQRGTGDAVESARSLLENSDSLVLVLSGDVPMIRVETLQKLIEQHNNTDAACSILSVRLENPTSYGRIVRDANGAFRKIVEQRDATEEERQVREINSGIYCFEAKELNRELRKVEPKNDQGEYYLTDVAEIILGSGGTVSVYVINDPREVSGINTRAELAEFENLIRRSAIRRLMIESGVTFIDPSHAYISAEAQIGRDTIIHPNVSIEG